MKTKIFFAALVAMLLSTFMLSAQRPTAEQVARRMTDRMTKQLNLTPEQAEQVHVYHLDRMRDAESRFADRKGKAENPEWEMERSIVHVTSRMQEMLTGDQFAKWEQSQKQKTLCGEKNCCEMGHKNCKCKEGRKHCKCMKGHKHHEGKMKKEARKKK